MKFTSVFTFLCSAAMAAANSVTFISLDDIHRTIIFTASVPYPAVEPVRIPARATIRVDIPWSWIGNWYAVSDGKPNVPGMLGEVTFQGWNSLTYFDVSAIVNPNDHEGVKELYPASKPGTVSGCNPYPCNNAYYLPDDVQTKTTMEVDLVCTLGAGYIARREEDSSLLQEDSENVARSFVLGEA
jgi:hypothetical protein